VFVQPFEVQAGGVQAGGDIAQRMDPVILRAMDQLRGWIRIITRVVSDQRFAFKIRRKITGHAVGCSRYIIKHKRNGMPFGEIECAAWFEEIHHRFGPARDIGQPVQRAPGHEDEIERSWLGDSPRRVVEIGFDKVRAFGQAEFKREFLRGVDRGVREIKADDFGATLRQTEDWQEAKRAFQERRRPEFKGR